MLWAVLLKKMASVLARPLTNLFNLSMKDGNIPTEWKKANISPIFKKGSKANPGNYRPVALTCILGKIMEKILVSHPKHVQTDSGTGLRAEAFLVSCIETNLLSETMKQFAEVAVRRARPPAVRLSSPNSWLGPSEKRIISLRFAVRDKSG